MTISELFDSDITRPIPPVVYFHEKDPAQLKNEVDEYIITGGWPEGHPNHERTKDGIHEQYVRLLTNISRELAKEGGPELPTAWISGFYGSGKSSFAKLLGMALDGVALPDGTSLAEAWLKRNTSPRAHEMRDAWKELRQKVEPISVVFDIGGIARDHEHVHVAALRQIQSRLGYCAQNAKVALAELKLERDGEWKRFEDKASEVLGKSWKESRLGSFADEDFSVVMCALYPSRYPEPLSWFTAHGGSTLSDNSPAETVQAIADMLRFRAPDATLFLVVDEVSQYVLANKDRVDRLRAFATELGTKLRGKVWLIALGQQMLDDGAGESFLVWAKDRFPPQLRVHLSPNNIRDVVYLRLLKKKEAAKPQLHQLFEKHRAELKLHAYGCETITSEDFVDMYPMLPGQIDLILQITTQLRIRSNRAQGDDQAIRGLLQLLGELFRTQGLANKDVGQLVTLEHIYEVQHTALDADIQNSMTRLVHQCGDDTDGMKMRVAKAVAMLELIQETLPTDAKLVAQCLYPSIGAGSQLSSVSNALESLRQQNLLGYSEKNGYKIQSSAGEEWERDRRDIPVGRDAISELIQASLKELVQTPEKPRMEGRSFSIRALFSDSRIEDIAILDPRDPAAIVFDFRFLPEELRVENSWVVKSANPPYSGRIIWIAGKSDVAERARNLHRSQVMVNRYRARRESLNPAKKQLLMQEETNVEAHKRTLQQEVANAWLNGKLYFRGGILTARDHGSAFTSTLQTISNRHLPAIFPHFNPLNVMPEELKQLIQPELSGPSPKFMGENLGILSLDNGRYVPSCTGTIPTRVHEFIVAEDAVSGGDLINHFSGPPYGYTADVVKACVLGLIRGSKLKAEPEGLTTITAVRDAGVNDFALQDRVFKRATITPAEDDGGGPQLRARICKFFEDSLRISLDRENDAIADAVARYFPELARQLRETVERFNQLPGKPVLPKKFVEFEQALELCTRNIRQTAPTVKAVDKHLNTLRDGIQLMRLYHSELDRNAIQAVKNAHDCLQYQIGQLQSIGVTPSNVEAATTLIESQLASERPWREIQSIEDAIQDVIAAYQSERALLMAEQSVKAEEATARLKMRDGFATLTADQSHQVLRPLRRSITETTPEAIAPDLRSLRDGYDQTLKRAEEEANGILDEILHPATPIVRVDLKLHHREVSTPEEVEALIKEVRARLLDSIQNGTRVRLT